MPSDLPFRVQALESRVDAVESRQDAVETRTERLEQHYQTLSENMARVDAKLSHTATREDIARVDAHIDQAVNGLLRRALDAVPGQHSRWLTVAIVVISLVSLFVTAVHGFH